MEEMNNVVDNQETGIVESENSGIQTYDLEPEEKTFPVGKAVLGVSIVGALIYGGIKLWKRHKDKKAAQDLEEYEYEEDAEEDFFEADPEDTQQTSTSK